MTRGSKARRQKHWERAYEEVTTPLDSNAIVGLLRWLQAELRDGVSAELRTPRHALTYRQLLRYMPSFVMFMTTSKSKRCEAYKMALERAWMRARMTCFDRELFDELVYALVSVCNYVDGAFMSNSDGLDYMPTSAWVDATAGIEYICAANHVDLSSPQAVMWARAGAEA